MNFKMLFARVNKPFAITITVGHDNWLFSLVCFTVIG